MKDSERHIMSTRYHWRILIMPVVTLLVWTAALGVLVCVAASMDGNAAAVRVEQREIGGGENRTPHGPNFMTTDVIFDREAVFDAFRDAPDLATRNPEAAWPIYVGGLLWASGLYGLARVLWRYFGLLFVLTPHRVIITQGLLTRTSLEMRLDKLESVLVSRGLLDRLFGSGTLVFVGAGGSRHSYRRIAAAATFERLLRGELADASSSRPTARVAAA